MKCLWHTTRSRLFPANGVTLEPARSPPQALPTRKGRQIRMSGAALVENLKLKQQVGALSTYHVMSSPTTFSSTFFICEELPKVEMTCHIWISSRNNCE